MVPVSNDRGLFAPPLPGVVDALLRRMAPPWPDQSPGSAAGFGARFLRPLTVLLAVAVLGQSSGHALDVGFGLGISRINADDDNSVAGWLGTTTTLLVAWGAVHTALLRPALRLPLGLLAALCASLSLDDMLALHEIVARLALPWQPYAHAGYNLWPLVYLPLMTATAWLLARTARALDPSARNAILGGLMCLVGAVALEFAAPLLYAVGSGHGQWLYESEVLVEEALETLGWGSIALGLWAGVLDVLLSPEMAPRTPTDAPTDGPASSCAGVGGRLRARLSFTR